LLTTGLESLLELLWWEGVNQGINLYEELNARFENSRLDIVKN